MVWTLQDSWDWRDTGVAMPATLQERMVSEAEQHGRVRTGIPTISTTGIYGASVMQMALKEVSEEVLHTEAQEGAMSIFD